MNFNTVFRWSLHFLFLILLTFHAAADTLLIWDDNPSASYRMAVNEYL